MKPVWLVGLTVGLFGCGNGGDGNGEPPEPPWPRWAFEHWVWEDESTQQSATALVEDYLAHDIPVGGIIIDSPWETGYNTFVFDPQLYPDPREMIDGFHARDVRVMLWIVSAINTDVTDLYAQAAAAGYFMQQDEDSGPAVIDWWKGEGSLIDYFNPEAVSWWHGLMDGALDLGIDGWKCDGLDFAAAGAPWSPGRGQKVTRIEYSHAYYRDFFETTRARLGEDRIITARPVDNYGFPVGGQDVAFAPVDINWAGWVGDQDANFGGLRAALLNMAESSKMGYVAFGSDIGGYREDDAYPTGRSKEVFIRWAQMGAFCPVMENGGGGEHRPWMFEDPTTAVYRRFAKIHHALIPYLMEHGARAFERGESLMTFLDEQDYHYLLGPDILVAPMLEEGTRRTVTFPEGSDWAYLFDTSLVYHGGTQTDLHVPCEEFPAFFRQGSEIESSFELP